MTLSVAAGAAVLCTGWIENSQPLSTGNVTLRSGPTISIDVPLNQIGNEGLTPRGATVHRYAWTCAGDLSGVDRGEVVTASVRLADGTTSCFAAAFIE